MYRYPPKDQTQFYSNDKYSMYLTVGSILNDKHVDDDAKKGFVSYNDPDDWKPYEDMRWCE
jgi:hypothetical protein